MRQLAVVALSWSTFDFLLSAFASLSMVVFENLIWLWSMSSRLMKENIFSLKMGIKLRVPFTDIAFRAGNSVLGKMYWSKPWMRVSKVAEYSTYFSKTALGS